jgi:c-di-GMP-binding flagellar brake protein YcgR
MKFEDLKLNYGYPLQLQTAGVAGQSERYSCRLIGCLPGRSILLSVPKLAGKLVRLKQGQKIIVRLMIDNGVGVFASQIEIQTVEPYPILHIQYPENITFKGIRGATRVSVEQAVVANNLTDDSQTPTQGMIVDISVTGARIELAAPIGKIGDEIELRGSVLIQEVKRDFKIGAIIRSQVETLEDSKLGGLTTSYGLEFVEKEEENRLIMYAYVYSQMAVQENRT